MRTGNLLAAFALLLLLVAPSSGTAVTIWNEGTQGDLPDPPIRIQLTPGDNELFGSLDPIVDPSDRIEIEIPDGFKIDDLVAMDDQLAPGLDL